MKSELKDFDIAFTTWYDKCREMVQLGSRGGTHCGYDLLHEEGRRYVKLFMDTGDRHTCWAFVDKTNGDILKSASWKAPAKGYRGNLYDEDSGMRYMQWTGPMYIDHINAIDDMNQDVWPTYTKYSGRPVKNKH